MDAPDDGSLHPVRRAGTPRAKPADRHTLQALVLTAIFVFGIVGLALNAEAFVKSSDQKSEVKRLAPQGTSVTIDDSDVVGAGGAVLAFCAVIAIVSLVSLVLHLLSPLRSLSTRTLPVQGVLLAIGTLGLFASLVAMTDFVANRQAKVSASIGGTQLPPSFVQGVEQLLGTTPVYHKIGYRECSRRTIV